MLNAQDLNDFGIISAKKAEYIAHNKMDNTDKSILLMVLSLKTLIAKAILDNKFEIETNFCDMHEESKQTMLAAKRHLEELGYKVNLNIFTIPAAQGNTTYSFKINWEGKT